MKKKNRASIVIAVMISASVTILAIGVLNLMAEISERFGQFLTFWAPMGPLSGKISLSYALGILVFLALFRIKSLERQSLVLWTVGIFGATVLSSLLLFTPFLHLIL